MTIIRAATRRAAAVAAASALAVLSLGGCSSDDDPADTAAPESSSTSAEPSVSLITPTAEEPPEPVDANTASVDDLTAAFEAAGVDDAAKWAQEVEALRPYTADDNWASLKTELGKLNIDGITFAKIVSVLEA